MQIVLVLVLVLVAACGNAAPTPGNASVEISHHDHQKTAYKLTFDPAIDFVQSDYANEHPHTPDGADRKVHAKGTTTIVCPP